jgi:hypothetical protein
MIIEALDCAFFRSHAKPPLQDTIYKKSFRNTKNQIAAPQYFFLI